MYIEEKIFERTDFTLKPLPIGEYDRCKFINCNLSNSDLSNIVFSDCEFKGCNLSMAKLKKTALRDIRFIDSKLLGLSFETTNNFLFEVKFDNCTLNLSSFYHLKLKKSSFKSSSLHEVDFTGADLSGAVFDQCDLMRAIFINSILEKTDFRTAYNYSIDPEANRIKKAKFSIQGVAGLLHKYDIEID